MLRAVYYGWREEQAKTAKEIVRQAEELYRRLAVEERHLLDVGKSLENSVKALNGVEYVAGTGDVFYRARDSSGDTLYVFSLAR